jgi:hypothetical protein
MPTLFTTSRSNSVTSTGNADMRSHRGGTLITYSGALTLNGERLTDPATLRKVWAEIGSDYLAEADRTEHGDRREHYTARARCVAYAAGVDVLDKTTNPRDALTLLEEIRRLGVQGSQEVAETGYHQVFVDVLSRTLARMLDELEKTARYEWLEIAA